MFMMLFTVKESVECNVIATNSLRIWHERLGHADIKYVKDTLKNLGIEFLMP